jgi:hypothetical protein
MKKFNNIMKYKCTYIGGSGTEYNDGNWILKRTPKRIIVEKVEEYMSGVFANHEVGEKIRIGKGTGNPIKDEEDDGSFTVYFKQEGTPYIFEPISNQ